MVLIEILVSMLILVVAALAVTATVAAVSGKEMRSAGGSSLDLQALNYARQTLEELKDAVSTDATRAAPLSIGTHTQATDPTLLPSPKGLPDSDLANHLGTSDGRTYVVSSVAGTDLTKVVVSVTWTD